MGQNPGSTIVYQDGATAKKTARRKLAILIVEAVVALGVLAFVAQALWSNTGSPQTTASIPQKIAGLGLQKSETGPQAVENFNRLHGKDVGATTGWVGYYEGNGIVWVAEVANEARAYQLMDAMTRRIRAGNDMFGNLDQLRVGDQAIFTVVGQGQRHYYYQRGSKVIWIAAPRIAERAFLDDALRQID